MELVLAVALVATVAAFVVLLDRKDKRAHQERERDRKERADVLQRIQAPELAVVQHQIAETLDAPQPPGTDDEYWKLSDEHAQAVAALEARENAFLER